MCVSERMTASLSTPSLLLIDVCLSAQGNLGSALHMENIDTGSGVLFPFWDEGTKMIYLAGKVRE